MYSVSLFSFVRYVGTQTIMVLSGTTWSVKWKGLNCFPAPSALFFHLIFQVAYLPGHSKAVLLKYPDAKNILRVILMCIVVLN